MRKVLVSVSVLSAMFVSSALADGWSSPFDSGVKPCWRLAEAKRGIAIAASNRFEVAQTAALADSTAFTFAARFRLPELPGAGERIPLVDQALNDTGFSFGWQIWGGGSGQGSMSLAYNGVSLNGGMGHHRLKKGKTHELVLAVRKGMVSAYLDGHNIKNCIGRITPNLEPIVFFKDAPESDARRTSGATLEDAAFWGGELEFYAKGESKDYPVGFVGGKGWTISVPTKEVDGLPRILYIGDSISNGYNPYLRKRLEGRANAYHWAWFVGTPGKNDYAERLTRDVASYRPFDIIVFNNGLHSLQWGADASKTSDEDVRASYRSLVHGLRAGASNAKLVYLLTTPHTGKKGANGKVETFGELNPVVQRLNRLACEVMAEEGLATIDGYSLLSGRLELASGDGYHWGGTAYDLLAENIVARVLPRGLPVCRAPLAWGKAARRAVRLESFPFTFKDQAYDGAQFVCGNKSVVFSGYEREAVTRAPLRGGEIALKNGAICVGMLRLCPPRAQDNLIDPADKLTVDVAHNCATWTRPYVVPGKGEAVFSVTCTGTDDGKLLVDYDCGITEDEAAKLERDLNVYPLFKIKNIHGVWQGWGDEESKAPDRDQLIAEGKQAHRYMVSARTNVYNFAQAADPRHWAIEFPQHVMPHMSCLEYVGEVKNGVLECLRSLHFFVDRFRQHNAAKYPVKGRVVIDFGKTAALAGESYPVVGGIDAWTQDAVHWPVRATYNQLPNGSFEQDFKGWHWGDWGAEFNEAKLLREAISDDGKFGHHALWLRGGQWRTPALVSGPMALTAGQKYVLSWYAKVLDSAKAINHNVSIISAGQKGRYFELSKKTKEAFPNLPVPADGAWHRFERTFEADAFGACVKIRAELGLSDQILIDGVQLAPEGSPTGFGEEPFVANLVSSSPYNDLKPGEEDSLSLDVQAFGVTSGKLRVRLFDYYYRTAYDRTFDLDGDAKLPMGLTRGRLGKGLFVVRLDYDCGKCWTDYARFVIQEPLDGTHATARFFANHPWFRRVSRARHYLKKFVEWGWNSMENCSRRMSDTGVLAADERKLGVRNYFNALAYWFGQKVAVDLNASLPPADRLEVLEFRKWDRVLPKHLAYVEKLSYLLTLDAEPSDDIWTFAGEEESWVRRPEIGYEAHYELNQAVRRGVTKAFAERGLPPPRMAPTQGTSHYFNGRNYDVIDGYLKTAAAHGYKYDVIAVHPYQNIDGGVQGAKDADLETQHLMAQMREYGYSEATPIYFTESFNMHPTYIPMWGASGWGDSYRAHTQPSQDMGNYEFLTAASQARICIIGLKFWPRLAMQHTWNNAPALDIRFTPYATVVPVNTLGHLLPSPKYYGDAQPYGDVRGYCFIQGDHAVMPVWTTNHEVEWGCKKGAVLEMELPADTTFVDLCGNACAAEPLSVKENLRTFKIPLTPAPLFLVSKDAEGLLKGLREAVADDPATAISLDVRPDISGTLNLVLQNETKVEKKGTVKVGDKAYNYTLASRGQKKIPLVTEDIEPMKIHAWSSDISLLSTPWELKWFYVPPCGEKPDWQAIPALPLDNVRGEPRGKAEYKMAYNKDYLFLRVEVEDPAYESYTVSGRGFDPANLYNHDGCLEVYFDGFADARAQGTKSYDLNDSRYDFLENNVHRLFAVNWQLAQGTDSATDKEIREKLVRSFTRTGKGYVYEIAFAARYMAPVDLKPGTVAGIGLTLHQFAHGKDGKHVGGYNNATRAGYTCNLKPYVWPVMVLK